MKKVKIQKSYFDTFKSSGPQGNLKQLFFVLTQSQKSMPAKAAHTLAKIKWYVSGPHLKKNNFLFQPSSPLPIETLRHKNH
jgi:hypothetical protein